MTQDLRSQYRSAVIAAFPPVIHASGIIKDYWTKIESYFPKTQIFAVDDDQRLIGFANMVMIHWVNPMEKLPQDGWDWLVKKSIHDYEQNLELNTLGGLQIIVTKNFLGKGYSKKIITEIKKRKEHLGLQHLIIPIRPTLKHQFPRMKMSDYLNKKEGDKIYDPWIRTHVNGGARIVSVCSESMRISGHMELWKSLLHNEQISSGDYIVEGGLNTVAIDVSNDHGVYLEENIWISYDV